MDTKQALRTLGRHRRRIGEMHMTGYPHLAYLRRRARRQRAVRVWGGRILKAVGFMCVTVLSVALMLSL